MASIFIYTSSYSCSDFNVKQLEKRLEECSVAKDRIKLIQTPEELKSILALENRATLIIPGGHYMKLSEELSSQIIKIQSCVEKGWNYLGFCSAAIFGSNKWIDSELISDASRHYFNNCKLLNLLNTTSQTPVYPMQRKYTKDKNGDFYRNNSRLIPISTKKETELNSFWSEGPSFVYEGKDTSGHEVLATYSETKNNPPAVIKGKYGEGTVILSGIHPEISYLDVDQNQYPANISKNCTNPENINFDFIYDIFRQLALI